MEGFGTFVTILICFSLAVFLTVASVNFFQAPVVVQTEPVILKIKSGWELKIKPGHYRLGEKIEKKITYDKQIIEETK